MSISIPPLLVVDDERNMRLSLEAVMADEGYETKAVQSAEEGLRLLEEQDFLMVITDVRLGGMSGYEFLGRVKTRWPDLPVLLITAFATPKLAVEAIKAGAIDYLAKPFAPEELIHAVNRCAERHGLLAENQALRARAEVPAGVDQIIGESSGLQELRQLIQTVAPTNATVLILGESGTGKELVAGALHQLSLRREKTYVRINCAAIPETLLESELFGHEKGAFTGAVKQKAGRVEEADGGTIFLDEIGDMSRSLQAKLLRFLEDGSFTRVGGTQELRVDVRLIAATNRDIIEAIREGHFREDLYHRLNVVQFRPPPLRERADDILVLAEHFLHQFSVGLNKVVEGFTPVARRLLQEHHWPGNVRELRNVIERAVILESTDEIQAGTLPDFQLEKRLRKVTPDGMATGVGAADVSLEDAVLNYEKDLIVQMLEQTHYSLAKAADQLKISRHALRYRVNRLHIRMSPSTGEGGENSGRGDAGR